MVKPLIIYYVTIVFSLFDSGHRSLFAESVQNFKDRRRWTESVWMFQRMLFFT